MATAFPGTFESIDTVETPQPNAEFSLQRSDVAWLILSGNLDLFLVGDQQHVLAGARYPVFRAEMGQAVFGVGPSDGFTQLVAAATPGTRLLLLTTADLASPAFLPGVANVHDLAEVWARALISASSESLAPTEILVVHEDEVVSVKRAARALVPDRPLLWLTHRKGSSLLTGTVPLPEASLTGFFPLTRQGWLLTQPESVVSLLTSEALLHSGRLFTSLNTFYAVIIPLLVNRRDGDLLREQHRLNDQALADRAAVNGALWRLASPLVVLRNDPHNDESCNNPIFLAAQAVGKRLGIRIKPDPNMLRGVHAPDAITNMAKASAAQVRRIALKGSWWKEDCGPLLAFEDESKKPVALLPRSSSAYDLFDPSDRSYTRVDEACAAGLNPFAYCFYRPFPSKKLSGMDLLKFGLLGCRTELATILWMGLAAGLLALFTPIVTGIIFDRLIPGAERGQLMQVSAILAVISVAIAMFTLARSFAVLRLEGKLDSSLQAAYWDRLLSLPVPFFRAFSSGDLAVRSLAIAQIRQTLTGSAITAVLSGIFSVFSFGLLFVYSWRMALFATALVAFAFLASTAFGYAQMTEQRGVLHLRGKLSGLVLQMIDGFAKFRVSGTEQRAFAFWAREFSKQKLLAAKIKRITNFFTVFNSVFPLLSLGAIFYFHAYLLTQPNIPPITTGEFLAFLAAYTQLLTAVLLQSSAIISVIGVIPIYERAVPILRTVPEVNESKGNPGTLSGAIEVSHVSFRYSPDSPLVLRDISLQIAPGEYVAFVGSSGSGKSTLLRLLLGFEKPESGAVYYDAQDIEGLDLQSVRRQIGVVLQTSRPIAGDIFTNIVGSAPLTFQDAWEAVRLAGMEKDIKQMPMGLHTMVSDGGGSLSGGQRQRLMIARAIVSRPRMLFFDEATSALDNRTQAVVSQSLESFQTTRVVIAHRLSTIMNADRIYVMDKGTIAQMGTYAELMAEKGPFAELAKRQVV